MCFCSPGTNLVELYERRAVPCASEASNGGTKQVGNCKFIPGFKFCWEHWRDRGISSYKFVLGAEAKAKTVTSLLSVLWLVAV